MIHKLKILLTRKLACRWEQGSGAHPDTRTKCDLSPTKVRVRAGVRECEAQNTLQALGELVSLSARAYTVIRVNQK